MTEDCSEKLDRYLALKAQVLRRTLAFLLNDVKASSQVWGIKLNYDRNKSVEKMERNLEQIFICQFKSIDVSLQALQQTSFFSEINCDFYIAYKDKDVLNTQVDGCVLRAIHQMYCHNENCDAVDLAKMIEIDKDVKNVDEVLGYVELPRLQATNHLASKESSSPSDLTFLNCMMDLFHSVRHCTEESDDDDDFVCSGRGELMRALQGPNSAIRGSTSWIAYAPFPCSAFAEQGRGIFKDSNIDFARHEISSTITFPNADSSLLPRYNRLCVSDALHIARSPVKCFSVWARRHAFVVKPPSLEDSLESANEVLHFSICELYKRLKKLLDMDSNFAELVRLDSSLIYSSIDEARAILLRLNTVLNFVARGVNPPPLYATPIVVIDLVTTDEDEEAVSVISEDAVIFSDKEDAIVAGTTDNSADSSIVNGRRIGGHVFPASLFRRAACSEPSPHVPLERKISSHEFSVDSDDSSDEVSVGSDDSSDADATVSLYWEDEEQQKKEDSKKRVAATSSSPNKRRKYQCLKD